MKLVTAALLSALLTAPAALAQTAASDPFIWLEDIDSPKALAWVEAQNARTAKRLEGDPRYEAFLVRAPAKIAAAARTRRGPALAQALMLWERATDLASFAKRNSLDPKGVAFELGGLLAALADPGRRAA